MGEDFPDTEEQSPEPADPMYLTTEEREALQAKEDTGRDHLQIVQGIMNDDARFRRYKQAYEDQTHLAVFGETQPAETKRHLTANELRRPEVERIIDQMQTSDSVERRREENERRIVERTHRALEDSMGTPKDGDPET